MLLTESVSAISYCGRPRCLNIMTVHLSGLEKAFVIFQSFQSKQQEPNMLKSQTDLQNAAKTMETVDWRPPKFGFWSREKIARGRVLVVTAVTQSCYPPAPNQLYFKTLWEGVYSQLLQGNEINRRLVSSVRRSPVSGAGGRRFKPRPEQHSIRHSNFAVSTPLGNKSTVSEEGLPHGQLLKASLTRRLCPLGDGNPMFSWSTL